MTYRGQVENGRIVLPEDVFLPEGAEVEVTVRTESGDSALAPTCGEPLSIEDEIASIWAGTPASTWDRLPSDLSDNLDHYIYGTPRE